MDGTEVTVQDGRKEKSHNFMKKMLLVFKVLDSAKRTKQWVLSLHHEMCETGFRWASSPDGWEIRIPAFVRTGWLRFTNRSLCRFC